MTPSAEPTNTPGSMPASKPKAGAGLDSTRISHSADGPLKVAFIYVGPVGDFGWTYAHEQGRKEAQAHFGDKVVTSYVENVAEALDGNVGLLEFLPQADESQ